MEENIHHTGIVLSVKDTTAKVQIVQSSACAACEAKAMCVSTESKEQLIDALMLEPLQPGDRVEIAEASCSIKLIKLKERSFVETLRCKITV